MSDTETLARLAVQLMVYLRRNYDQYAFDGSTNDMLDEIESIVSKEMPT